MAWCSATTDRRASWPKEDQSGRESDAGIAWRCPTCGKGRLFDGYLRIRSPCEVCTADNLIYPSDDFPPYLTILAVGHIIAPLFIVTDNAYALPLLVEGAIWLPTTLLMCLVTLPFMKGATVGLCWATKLTRRDSEI